MKLSQVATYLFVYGLALGFMACSSGGSGDKPELPTTWPPITVIPNPPTTVGPVCPEPSAGSYKCYDWGPCNGIFHSRAEAIAILNEKDPSGCSKLDDEQVKGGFGPCSQCIGYTTKAMMFMSAPAMPARISQ